MQRPTGVTTLSVLAIIGGILQILGSLVYMSVGGLFTLPSGIGFEAEAVAGAAGIAVLTFGYILAALGLLYLVVGIGGLALRPWAWTSAVILSVVHVILAVVTVLTAGFTTATVIGSLPSVIIPLAILMYLYTEPVRIAFCHTRGLFAVDCVPKMGASA